jgi:hypothetical protein
LTGVNNRGCEGANDEGKDGENVKVSFFKPSDFVAGFDDNFAGLAP